MCILHAQTGVLLPTAPPPFPPITGPQHAQARLHSAQCTAPSSSSLAPAQVVGSVGFQGKMLDRPQHPSEFLVDLCMRCMNHQPQQRPSFPVRALLLPDSWTNVL